MEGTDRTIERAGQIMPVLNVKKFFDLPDAGITDLHMVIIVHAQNVELGILADAVAGVRSIALEDIQPSLPTLTGIRAAYLKGITNEHVAILDAPELGHLMQPALHPRTLRFAEFCDQFLFQFG